MSQAKTTCALGLSSQQLSAWYDHLLPEAKTQRITLHVADCAACQRRLTQFTQIAASIKQPAPDLRAQTWRGLQARLAQKEPSPMRIPRSAAFGSFGAAALAVLLIVLFVLVINHRPNNTTPGATTPTASSTSTPTAANCASALPGAGSASAGSSFTDLPLPPQSVSTGPTKSGGGGDGQFTLFTLELCTSGTSTSAVDDFFSHLTSHGWLHSNTFPSDGSYQANCANASCWAKDVRYVSLAELLTDLGGGVIRYHLTLATAPPVPTCSSYLLPGYYYELPDPHYTTTPVFAHIPLPPLSRIGPDNASGGVRGYAICSAGTVTSINAFMSAHLTALGWSSLGSGTWSKDGYDLHLQLTAATSWAIWWRDPDIHF